MHQFMPLESENLKRVVQSAATTIKNRGAFLVRTRYISTHDS